MKTFLEYIILNYTWFLGGAIIILLAIIGSYADKTNFGQGKTKKDDSEKLKELELEKFKLQQQLEQAQKNHQNLPMGQKETKQKQENQDVSDVYDAVQQIQQTVNGIENKIEQAQVIQGSQPVQAKKTTEPVNKEEPTLESYEEKYAKFDKAFDALLPKKGFDDGDLLDDIESISLDKTQKIDITSIPDLDDVDLPKIKSLDPIDEDIWKF